MVRCLEPTATTSATPPASTPTAAATLLKNHKMFLSVGHDEYWSGASARQRRGGARRRREPGVLQRQRGVLEDPLGELERRRRRHAYRTLVSYKETHDQRQDRPAADLDGHLARPAVQPAGRRRPAGERAHRHASSRSTAARRDMHGRRPRTGSLRFWRNTASRESLAPGATTTLGNGIARLRVGRESGQRLPARRADRPVQRHPAQRSSYLQDYGSTYAAGTATHNLTLYRAPAARWSSAPARIQWAWGLDNNHAPTARGAPPSTPRCSRRPSTCSPTWARSRHAAAGLVAATASRPTRRRRPRRSPPRRPARRVAGRLAADDQRHRDRRRRRRGRRGRGVDRRRHAPGTRPPGAASWSYTFTPGRATAR